MTDLRPIIKEDIVILYKDHNPDTCVFYLDVDRVVEAKQLLKKKIELTLDVYNGGRGHLVAEYKDLMDDVDECFDIEEKQEDN